MRTHTESAWCKGNFKTITITCHVNTLKSIPTQHCPPDSSFCTTFSGKGKGTLRTVFRNGSHPPPIGQPCQRSQDGAALTALHHHVTLARRWPKSVLNV